ncbi:mevalonate kinase [Prolixibacteraceae bacterium JC049]|nr:mevalonate kinase [Prolixibacteraceae bacterium JC049]
MHSKNRTYSAKLLLFGEYGLLYNSMGLAVPYPRFSGQFSYEAKSSQQQKSSQESLWKLFQYLQNNSQAFINTKLFEQDLKNGLWFQSSIPQKYGLGSSGALVAAIYDQYVRSDLKQTDYKLIKSQLADIESFFHGKSSGIDPLVSYSQKPFLVNKEIVEPVDIHSQQQESPISVFLIDTGMPGSTQVQMDYFMHRCQDKDFLTKIRERFIPGVNSSIRAYLKGMAFDLFLMLDDMVRFQLEYFEPMIPSTFVKLIKLGLDSGEHFIKLCGSGGGGYLLGFTHDINRTREVLRRENIEIIPLVGK